MIVAHKATERSPPPTLKNYKRPRNTLECAPLRRQCSRFGTATCSYYELQGHRYTTYSQPLKARLHMRNNKRRINIFTNIFNMMIPSWLLMKLGGAPSEGGIIDSSSFPSIKEPRFIEPVGHWNQQQSECWRSLALNLQQTWTCIDSTKCFAPNGGNIVNLSCLA